MPTKRFSEIDADPELLKQIEMRAASGEIDLPDSVVEDATGSAQVPELESIEAQTFIHAVEHFYGLPRGDVRVSPSETAPTTSFLPPPG